MPRINIEISPKVSKELKRMALENGRSLNNFIPRYLEQCIDNSIIKFDTKRGVYSL